MTHEILDQTRLATCPACGHHVAVALLAETEQPLATLAWPSSAEEANAMPRLPLTFVRCVDCGHVYNTSFDYSAVPYSDKPNLMFNRGQHWGEVLIDLQKRMRDALPENPRVVEIGHGDGSFLHGLLQLCGRGTFVGFDPHGCGERMEHLEYRQELFLPSVHLAELKPDLVISRHVLEHLSNPLGFLQELSFAAGMLKLETLAYFEVPCVDRILRTNRTVDLYYEHSSQFTTSSFNRMLSKSTTLIEQIGHIYDREVVFAFVRLGAPSHADYLAREAQRFQLATNESRDHVRQQLAELHSAGRTVVVWGGTGKSAAFMNRYEVDAERFPLVVDSDPDKAGTFVPGMGQEICFRDQLKSHPPAVIVVPPQWRARDIHSELLREQISFEQLLIEHDGRLIDFLVDEHPYRL